MNEACTSGVGVVIVVCAPSSWCLGSELCVCLCSEFRAAPILDLCLFVVVGPSCRMEIEGGEAALETMNRTVEESQTKVRSSDTNHEPCLENPAQ